jgi:hypothetical protein
MPEHSRRDDFPNDKTAEYPWTKYCKLNRDREEIAKLHVRAGYEISSEKLTQCRNVISQVLTEDYSSEQQIARVRVSSTLIFNLLVQFAGTSKILKGSWMVGLAFGFCPCKVCNRYENSAGCRANLGSAKRSRPWEVKARTSPVVKLIA